MIKIDDIVRFTKSNGSKSSDFCVGHNLTGKVSAIDGPFYILDFGLGYDVYSMIDYIEIAAKKSDIPVLDDL